MKNDNRSKQCAYYINHEEQSKEDTQVENYN